MEREVRKVVTFGARRRWRRIVGLVIMELRLLGDEGKGLRVDAGGCDVVDDDGSDGAVTEASGTRLGCWCCWMGVEIREWLAEAERWHWWSEVEIVEKKRVAWVFTLN
uniref:Uncharacterized protein n=1 Tax=Fagus sylvatica TaxID=28930 RepID=A0A2N9GPM7_FAGSY